MRARLLLAAGLAALALAGPASASQEPQPGEIDPRIRTVRYDAEEVVLLKGFFGYQMMLEFAPDERIENVSIGDALAWQVTPNRKANLLFLKPLERTSTNMTVVTDKRRYSFELTVPPDRLRLAEMAYVVRFLYPQEGPVTVVDTPPPPPPPEVIPPEAWNFSYVFTGAKGLQPDRVFDDGKATFFSWPATASAPAIFAIGADGQESLVNYAVRGRYFVVDQVAARFVLRSGKDALNVVNQGYAQTAASAPARSPGG